MRAIYLSVMIFLLSLLFISCDNKDYVQEEVYCTASPTNDTVVLDYNKSVPVFESCKENLHVAFIQVTDTRCPDDSACTVAGQAHVVLQMDNSFSVTLEPDIIIDTTYKGRSYSFQVVDVLPHPKTTAGVPANQQRAVAIIKRGNIIPTTY